MYSSPTPAQKSQQRNSRLRSRLLIVLTLTVWESGAEVMCTNDFGSMKRDFEFQGGTRARVILNP